MTAIHLSNGALRFGGANMPPHRAAVKPPGKHRKMPERFQEKRLPDFRPKTRQFKSLEYFGVSMKR
jgi:hypothetical protein